MSVWTWTSLTTWLKDLIICDYMYYLKIKNERKGRMRIIFNSEDKNAIYDFITRHGKQGQNYYITDSNFNIIEVLQK